MADIKEKSNNIPELQSPFEQLREVDACMVRNYENFAVCCLEKSMASETGLCTLIGTKLRTKPNPKVQITKFKVQKLAKNYPQSAKIALWKKSLYFENHGTVL